MNEELALYITPAEASLSIFWRPTACWSKPSGGCVSVANEGHADMLWKREDNNAGAGVGRRVTDIRQIPGEQTALMRPRVACAGSLRGQIADYGDSRRDDRAGNGQCGHDQKLVDLLNAFRRVFL